MVLWQLRVVSAISLNDPMAGYDAGQKLLAAGAADSNDPNLQRLLGQIKNKGWLDKQIADKAEKLNHTISVIFTGDGQARSNTDGPVGINLRGRIEGNMIAELQSRFPHTNINIDTPDAGDPALRVTINLHDTDWDDSKCGLFSCDVYVNSQLLISISSPAGALVNRSFELHIKNSVSKGRSVVSAAKVAPLLPDWMGQEVLGKLRGVLDEDAVRTSMRQSPTP
jgi:hypothetical protein